MCSSKVIMCHSKWQACVCPLVTDIWIKLQVGISWFVQVQKICYLILPGYAKFLIAPCPLQSMWSIFASGSRQWILELDHYNAASYSATHNMWIGIDKMLQNNVCGWSNGKMLWLRWIHTWCEYRLAKTYPVNKWITFTTSCKIQLSTSHLIVCRQLNWLR